MAYTVAKLIFIEIVIGATSVGAVKLVKKWRQRRAVPGHFDALLNPGLNRALNRAEVYSE